MEKKDAQNALAILENVDASVLERVLNHDVRFADFQETLTPLAQFFTDYLNDRVEINDVSDGSES